MGARSNCAITNEVLLLSSSHPASWFGTACLISLLDLLANTGCHCVTSSSAGDKNTDEQLVTHNLERWPEHSQGDSQVFTSITSKYEHLFQVTGDPGFEITQ